MSTPQDIPTILFDGVCNLCNGWVNLVIDHAGRDTRFLFGALQSEEARELMVRYGIADEPVATIILIEDGQVWRESTAVLKILQHLKWPWSWMYVMIVVPAGIRDFVYRWVARNRYRWFGRRDQCRIPTPEYKKWFLENAGTEVKPVAAT